MSAMTSLPQRHTYYGGEVGVHTHEISAKPRKRHVTFGPYIVGSTLGEGEFGKVKLGWSKAASSSLEVPKQVAIKLIRRDSIPKNSEKEVKIYREINALKHLSHPNIVKLEEVLQNSKYIGIVLEYASGGEFYKYIQRKRRLKEAIACRLFAQLVSGVNYMHSKGLVHRDLKLENLLLDKHENLVITDFGFVNEFVSHNELMKTSCGSPCYAAPELVVSTKPYEARKSDVWSCGVILYAMLAGYLPWDDDPKNPDGNDIVRLYYYITRTPLKFPEYITPLSRDLLRRILVSDPKKRITLRSIHKHEWLKPHAAFISITPEEWDKAMSSKDVFRLPHPAHTRPKRPQSSCSTSSTGSKGEKRDSLIMDYTLVPLPAPPHQSQSHVITKPSPPSPEIRTSPVRNQLSRHTRSNSAASVALQAVVDAERDSNSMLSHPHGNGVNAVNGGTVSGNKLIPRSNTMSGNVSSLLNKDSVIVETSPSKSRLIEPMDENSIMRPPLNSISNVAASRTVHGKPRPTSYHPGSMATNTDNKDPPPTLSGVPNLSPTRPLSFIEPSPLDSTPSLVPDAGASSQEHSPKMLPRRSFSVSKPLLDLQSVNGDLIKSHGDAQPMARRLHEQVEDGDYKQRRQSRRYSSLFNSVTEEGEDMDQKSIAPQSRATSHTRSRTSSKTHSRQPSGNTNTVGGSEPVEPVKSRTTTTAGANTRDKDKKLDKKRFSFLSFYSSYNTSRSSIASEKIPSVPAPTSQPQQHRRVDSQSSRQNSISRMGTRNSLRVVGQTPLQQQQQQRQAPAQQQPPAQQQQPFTRTKIKKNRQSMMEPSQPQVRPQGEQSTAKKVMDFFKRRSMRV
ncbi:hypothetical protein ZYGR_0S01950 [Zygosaccharomyces rouxii]|uniref:non-specific serine/threonine protein kinase n=2 Tax=Zygosaccharomyces rouxii TaxID=4956 RepID=C5DXQ1_ZYGRC|nr:uncharacterized protein ZYRO0F06842g [Zygosaccharomyces rouxii]KAH9199321.1 kinase-like domain-containing protein [Zygosaccharomyces rouxii]GAV50061.1 hypothetical protein ZYGR_0S01950 [Zygosaccharomyces rouxii]CAR28562.1 ZYRO0F06842p [Zygosaccharomyces rouxii]